MMTTARPAYPHFIAVRIGDGWHVCRLDAAYGDDVLGPAATYVPVAGSEVHRTETDALAEASRRNRTATGR